MVTKTTKAITITTCDICKCRVGRITGNNDILTIKDKQNYTYLKMDLCFDCKLEIETRIKNLKKEHKAEEKAKAKKLKEKEQAKND